MSTTATLGAAPTGPATQGYVAALKSYDDAFGRFFDRLAADGINKNNTLFVVTADENDHYAGQQAQDCDGVNVPCQYNTAPGDPVTPPAIQPQHGIFDLTNGATTSTDPSTWNGPSTWPPAGVNGPLVGEVGYNLKWLMGSTIGGSGYDISFDSAPSFYINGQPQAVDSNGNVVVNPTLRAFEQKAANLQAFDPYIDPTKLTPVARYLVDTPTLKALHMINADPQRTMSFTMFSQPDYFFQTASPCPIESGVRKRQLRVDPRRLRERHRPDLAGGGRTRRARQRHQQPDLDRSHRHRPDHRRADRPASGLHAGWTGHQPDPESARRPVTGTENPPSSSAPCTSRLDARDGAFAHWLVVASTGREPGPPCSTYTSAQTAIRHRVRARRTGRADDNVLNGAGRGRREQLTRRGSELLLRVRRSPVVTGTSHRIRSCAGEGWTPSAGDSSRRSRT